MATRRNNKSVLNRARRLLGLVPKSNDVCYPSAL